MRASEVRVGGRYIARVSGVSVVVRITGDALASGWWAINEATTKRVRIKTAARLTERVR
jgi:hypothetical protein